MDKTPAALFVVADPAPKGDGIGKKAWLDLSEMGIMCFLLCNYEMLAEIKMTSLLILGYGLR